MTKYLTKFTINGKKTTNKYINKKTITTIGKG